MSIKEFNSDPASETYRRISFDSAEVIETANGRVLHVKGEAPCLNMEISLSPRTYVTCPEYWGIEVVGQLPGAICITAIKPYNECIPLQGITGYKGIEVIGSSKTERIEVDGGCKQGDL